MPTPLVRFTLVLALCSGGACAAAPNNDAAQTGETGGTAKATTTHDTATPSDTAGMASGPPAAGTSAASGTPQTATASDSGSTESDSGAASTGAMASATAGPTSAQPTGEGEPSTDGGSSSTGAVPPTAGQPRVAVYVGSGDWAAGAKGRIDVYALDGSTGALTPGRGIVAGTLLSFLAVDPGGRHLYAADEAEGEVRAFTIDASTGELTAGNTRATRGHPVHVAVDRSGGFLLMPFYNEGRTEVLALALDGALAGPVDLEDSGPHSHAVAVSPSNRHVFVPAVDRDAIVQYHFDAKTGALDPNVVDAVASPGGPRHLVFHPSLPKVYVVCETQDCVRVFDYDEATGRLEGLQTVARMPAGFSGSHSGAEIAVTPSGRFLYASNRAQDESSLAIYAIDPATGGLGLIGHTSTRGRTPRSFAVDPSGRWVLVANQESQTLVVFRLDEGSGRLTHVATHTLDVKPFYVGAFEL